MTALPAARDESPTTLLDPVPLTAADRCDRCGAAARVRAVLASGGELLFCQHHANEYAAGLAELAAKIETTPLTPAAAEGK